MQLQLFDYLLWISLVHTVWRSVWCHLRVTMADNEQCAHSENVVRLDRWSICSFHNQSRLVPICCLCFSGHNTGYIVWMVTTFFGFGMSLIHNHSEDISDMDCNKIIWMDGEVNLSQWFPGGESDFVRLPDSMLRFVLNCHMIWFFPVTQSLCL